jgi:NAD(P)-dependent dehydrogenase (short-subunit alcohol dehydrogenase family)
VGALIEGSSSTAGAPDPARVLESFRLDGKTALVTGSSRGLGRTAAIALAAAGARVVLAARTRGGLQETAIEVARLAAPEPLLIQVDVRDSSQLEEAFERAGRQAGELHVLINNAGIQRTGPAIELSLSDWRDVLETNVTAAFAASQLFARQSHVDRELRRAPEPGRLRRQQGGPGRSDAHARA